MHYAACYSYYLLYNKTRHSYIYVLSIAGQTAGTIELKFFVDTHGWRGGGCCYSLKEIEIFFQRRALQLVLKKRSDAPGLKFYFTLIIFWLKIKCQKNLEYDNVFVRLTSHI